MQNRIVCMCLWPWQNKTSCKFLVITLVSKFSIKYHWLSLALYKGVLLHRVWKNSKHKQDTKFISGLCWHQNPLNLCSRDSSCIYNPVIDSSFPFTLYMGDLPNVCTAANVPPLHVDWELPDVSTHTPIRLENILDKNIYLGAEIRGAAF